MLGTKTEVTLEKEILLHNSSNSSCLRVSSLPSYSKVLNFPAAYFSLENPEQEIQRGGEKYSNKLFVEIMAKIFPNVTPNNNLHITKLKELQMR